MSYVKSIIEKTDTCRIPCDILRLYPLFFNQKQNNGVE